MANNLKKAKDGAPLRGGFDGTPIVDILNQTANHIAWLDWFGRQFDQNMILNVPDLRRDPQPPFPGSCGVPLPVALGDVMGLVAHAEQGVRTVIDRLVGVPPRPDDMPGRIAPRPGGARPGLKR